MNFSDLIEERKQKQKKSGYNPDANYIGPEALPWIRYYKWMPFAKFMNWPSFLHDRDYLTDEDRTTRSNKLMFQRYCMELMLSGIEPWTLYYWAAITWFGLLIFPAITVIGRAVDKN